MPRHWGLISLAALIALIETGGFIRSIQFLPALAALVSLNPLMEMVAGALWALLFAVITVNLLRRRGTRAAIVAFSSFLLYSIARLWIFTRADYDQQRLPFLGVAALCLLVIAVVALWRR